MNVSETHLGSRGGHSGLGDLDVLHLNGVLGVGLRVVELADVHRGLLGLMGGSGLERAEAEHTLIKVKGNPFRDKV